MTTRTPDRSNDDRRPEKVKAMAKKLRDTTFPKCYGHCPDVDGGCPPEKDFKKFLKKHKTVSWNLLPKKWECRTCIYADTL